MSENHKSRNRIRGKKYSTEEYLPALDAAILELIAAGDYSPESIGRKLGKDRSVISKRFKVLGESGRIRMTETGRVEKTQAKVEQRAYEELSSSDFVTKNPEVQKWVSDMSHRGKGGKPLATLQDNVARFKRICDILKLNPQAFTVSKETNEELLKNLSDAMKTINPGLREAGWSRYAKALRNFAMSHGIAWERNMAPTIASGKKANYGSYSMIFANDEQRQGIIDFARSNFSPDLAMAIAVGHEALCPRDETLRTIKVGDVHFRQRSGFEVAEFEVYESKTETNWPKQLIDPRIVRALKEHIATKSTTSYLFGNGEPITRLDLAQALRKCYASVGIDVESDGNEKTINYWKEKPIHAMRHTTATMWMRRSGMNPLLVAKQGWKDVDMVTQIYANMGIEEAWNAGRCDFCKPDPSSTGDSHYCSWKCAVAGLNQRFGN